VDCLKEQVQAVVARYQGRLQVFQHDMEADLAPYAQELAGIQQAIEQELEQVEIALPALPKPEVFPDDQDWLFDTRRDYVTQLAYYKARQKSPRGDEPSATNTPRGEAE
jgi:hypothetical protein